jgi:hypothetical protein
VGAGCRLAPGAARGALALILILATLASAAVACAEQGAPFPSAASGQGAPGQPIVAPAVPVIDPTKNVLDLVLAAVTRLNDLRAAEIMRQDQLRDALDKRLTDMEAQRVRYEERIEALKSDADRRLAANLQAQADKSALLLSSQVDKLGTAFADRLAVVEKNQYVGAGTSAARDPAIAEAMKEMAATISALRRSGDEGSGRSEGSAALWAALVAGASLLVALAGVALAVMRRPARPA